MFGTRTICSSITVMAAIMMFVACGAREDDGAKEKASVLRNAETSSTGEVDSGTKTCNGATCAGCCTAEGECREPNPGYCGLAGSQCEECSTGQTCDIAIGECVDADQIECGPTTCPGCCNAEGECLFPGYAQGPYQCGLGGIACIECSGAEVCVAEKAACLTVDELGCGPATCPGCCTAEGECLGREQQSDRNMCGVAGGACTQCADGLTCDTFTWTCAEPEE
jgi:hypothetical protein